jgi:hypothetical protein
VVLDDVPGAAAILAKAPGLGWSDPHHPGHTLFPVLAGLLSKGNVDKALLAELEATGHDLLDPFTEADGRSKPRLTTPSVIALVQRSRPATALTDAHADAALDAMRVAAEKRVQGILEHSRRRQYGHAALLVASCVASAPKRRRAELSRWATSLREQHRRRHAFRTELARACEGVGVSLPT